MNSLEQAIEQQLLNFDSHGLADLHHANLQNRIDSKFILPLSLLPELLEETRPYYSVLQINGQRTSNYYNQYFDTQSMSFYNDHHNGKLNRYKVRKRTYLDTDTQFLEVKFKNNQKRTLKNRLRCDERAKANGDYQSFIQHHIGLDFDDLSESQHGGYRRIALANEAIPERLTLDFDLWYQSASGGKRIELNGFFIAELKQRKRSKSSPFFQLMSARNFFPVSFSKYCIGCALIFPHDIKYNRFKRTLMKLGSLNGTNPHTASRSF